VRRSPGFAMKGTEEWRLELRRGGDAGQECGLASASPGRAEAGGGLMLVTSFFVCEVHP